MLVTEMSAFMKASEESLEKQKKVITTAFQVAEEEGLTIQEMKYVLSRMEICINSAGIKNNMQTPFKKEQTH